MASTIKKLEKDNTAWKTRWEKANRVMAEMAEEQAGQGKVIDAYQAKAARLEELCRLLQSQRADFQRELKRIEGGAEHDTQDVESAVESVDTVV